MKEGIALAHSLGVKYVVFELDNYIVINTCSSWDHSWVANSIVKEVWHLIGNFDQCPFSKIRRLANRVADLVAEMKIILVYIL